MMHRRLQEGLLRVHGSIKNSYKTKAAPIPVIVGIFFCSFWYFGVATNT